MISIYSAKIDSNLDEVTYNRLLEYVSDATRQRVIKFAVKEDALRSLYGEIMVRHFIARKQAINKDDIIIKRNIYGKPYWQDEKLHFSISHSGNRVVCVISSDQVGIDIEQIKETGFQVAKRYFCETEYKNLMTRSGFERLDYFYSLWTLKESYLKFLGTGLTTPLNSFSVDIDGETAIVTDVHHEVQSYFKQFQMKKYKLSICAASSEFPDTIEEIEIEPIIFQPQTHLKLN